MAERIKTLKDRMLIKVWDTFAIKKQFHLPDNYNFRNGIKMSMKSIIEFILEATTLWDMEAGREDQNLLFHLQDLKKSKRNEYSPNRHTGKVYRITCMTHLRLNIVVVKHLSYWSKVQGRAKKEENQAAICMLYNLIIPLQLFHIIKCPNSSVNL